MTEEQLNEVIDVLTRHHQAIVDQLRALIASEGGTEVFGLAVKVMGNALNAAEWLTSRWVGLNGGIPAEVALSPEGREAVLTYLMQIEYMVYV